MVRGADITRRFPCEVERPATVAGSVRDATSVSITPKAEAASVAVFGRKLGAGDYRRLLALARDSKVQVRTDAGGRVIAMVSCPLFDQLRSFQRVNGELVAVHRAMAVRQGLRRQGVAFQHFCQVVPAYQDFGVARIQLTAERVGAGANGVDTWPRFGFDTRKDSKVVLASGESVPFLTFVREQLPRRYHSVGSLAELFELPHGAAAWARGSAHVEYVTPLEFDLAPGSLALYRLLARQQALGLVQRRWGFRDAFL